MKFMAVNNLTLFFGKQIYYTFKISFKNINKHIRAIFFAHIVSHTYTTNVHICGWFIASRLARYRIIRERERTSRVNQ